MGDYVVWSGSIAAYVFTCLYFDTLGEAMEAALDQYHRPHNPDVMVRRLDGTTLVTMVGA